jgi:leucyl/phenylalanyl-tRNA--protein transferase
MFNNMTNTSKLTLLYLTALLANNKFTLLDSQFYNPHLLQFGAYEINDDEYQQYLHKGINKKISFPQELNFQKSVSILQSLSQRS